MAKQPLSYALKRNLGLTKMKRMAKEASFKQRGGTRFKPGYHHPVLTEGLRGHTAATDISDHLNTLFFFAVDANPKLIVELGTRGGESTRVFLSVAVITGATMLSVDIEDCEGLDLPYRDKWNFMKADDVAFAKKGFPQWCAAKGLKPQVDVLFIDTSHLYEHTKQEIAAWAPLLSPNGTILFHDTNMRRGMTSRLDQSICIGIDNDRGVIRAVEEFLGKKYDENKFFTDIVNGFLVMHYAHCNGMTVLKKLGGR